MDNEIVTKLLLFGISLLFICAVLFSCASTHNEPKPQQVIVQGSYTVPNYNRLHSVDIVSHYELPPHVKKIFIQYQTHEIQPDDTFQLWQKAIQKSLLRKGFLIVQQDNVEDLFKEENNAPGYDAVCIVNSFGLTKQTDSISLGQDNVATQMQHIHYYIASISVSIAVNQTIIWQGDVSITSFDLLQNKSLIQEPTLYTKITYDYSYSKKLKRWIKDSPTISITDNFSKYYNDENIYLHKKELIQLAVSTLFHQLKVAQ